MRRSAKNPRLCLLSCMAFVLALATLRAAADPLPVETFFKKPLYGNPILSPSGRFLAVTTVVNGRRNVGVLDLDDRKVTPITSFTAADVIDITWQNDERMVVTAGDLRRGTGEPPQYLGLFAVNRDASHPMAISKHFERASGADVAFARGVGVSFVREIPGTDDILVASYYRTRDSLDLYRFDTLTGEKKLLSFDSPGNVSRWVVDFDGVPRAAVSDDLDHDKSTIYVRDSAAAGWQKIEETGYGRLHSSPLAFSPDGKTLYIESRRDGDRVVLYEYDIGSRQWNGPIAKHPERDINAVFVKDLRQRKLFGLWYTDDKPGSVWFDVDWARMQKSIDAALPDTVNVLQRRADRWIVTAYSDRDPGEVYLLDGKTMKMQKLLSYEPWINPAEMAPTRWVRYKARDGLTIPALLTVPPAAKARRSR